MPTAELLKKFNDLIPTLAAPKIVEMMRTHGVTINQLPALDSHPDKKAYVEGIMLKDEEKKEWAQVKPLVAYGNISNLSTIQAFIDKYKSYDFAAADVDEATRGIADLWRAQELNEWQYIQPHIAAPGVAALNALKTFIDKWQPRNIPGSHVFEAQQRYDQMTLQLAAAQKDAELREWNNLQYSSSIPDIVAHVKKWQEQGISIHALEADERAWQMVQTSTDRIGAIRQYLTYFPAGHHGVEANQAIASYDEWMYIKGSRDLLAVHNFINEFPSSLFIGEARLLKNELKEAEIRKMRDQQDQYSGDYLLQLIDQGIFSDNELVGQNVATHKSLEILRNLMEFRDNLPILQEVQAKCETFCAKDRTDVYLFGTPATGKTCILMGLIGSAYIDSNFVESAGEYASALELYLRTGFTPGQTVNGFVATVQATIQDHGNKHHINLVELAGEDFAINIANSHDVAGVNFSEMGEGVPELLSNSNRKVFFIIVDPTSRTLKVKRTKPMLDANGAPVLDEFGQPKAIVEEYIIDQMQSLSKMISMLQSPVNKAIMEKVDAIHVIMTKGDKLGKDYERDDKAYEHFTKRYRKIISPLTDLCREYGINQHPQKELNGVPRLFTFSLGQFFPGGIYEYDDTDANTLVDTIARCTQGLRPKTNWDRFCEVMNKPIF